METYSYPFFRNEQESQALLGAFSTYDGHTLKTEVCEIRLNISSKTKASVGRYFPVSGEYVVYGASLQGLRG
jgi:hypothetical protein